MTLLQLKYIVKIVECGSMNEASHELYVSQPALSASVRELEKELGIEIFTRSSQGIALTVDGAEFLTYARQVLDQAALLEERYKNAKPRKQLCSVATQHYMFAVEAFVEMINATQSDEYEFTIRETRTRDIINQVANLQSEIGILYLSEFNRQVIGKLLREKHLEFHPLFRSGLQVFISRDNPLAGRDRVTMKDLEPYPFIQFEQGEEGSFFFAEEAVWPENSPKQINVTDRAHDPQLHHRSERLHGVHRHRQRRPQQREDRHRAARLGRDDDGRLDLQRARAPVRRGRDLSGPAARGHRQARLRNPSDNAFPDRTGYGCHCY